MPGAASSQSLVALIHCEAAELAIEPGRLASNGSRLEDNGTTTTAFNDVIVPTVGCGADANGPAIHTDLLFYLVAIPATIVLGLSKGGFAGVGMVSTPLVALVAGPVDAAGILLPILVAQDCVALWMYRGVWSRPIIRTMAPGAAIGILIAFLLAASVRGAWVELMLGLISVTFSVQQLWQTRRHNIQAPARRPRPWLGVLSGLGAGFTSTVAHAGTPPFQFYVVPQRLDKHTYIGTSVVFFAMVNAMKIPAFAALGQFSPAHLATAAALLPLALFSSWLGVRLVRRVDPQTFSLLVNIMLAAVGLALIAEGAVGLNHG